MFALYLVAEEDPYFTNDEVLPYLWMGYSFMESPSPVAMLGMYSVWMAGGRCQVEPELPTGCGRECLNVEEALLQRVSCVSVYGV